MIDIARNLSGLRRPQLLVRAARIGVDDYKRERDLCRLMKTAQPPSPERAVTSLLDQENQIETTRKSGDASYSPVRHVEVLIALMAEARLLPHDGLT